MRNMDKDRSIQLINWGSLDYLHPFVGVGGDDLAAYRAAAAAETSRATTKIGGEGGERRGGWSS